MAKKPSSKANETPKKDVSPKDEVSETLTPEKTSETSAPEAEAAEDKSVAAGPATETAIKSETSESEPQNKEDAKPDEGEDTAKATNDGKTEGDKTETANITAGLPAPAQQPAQKVSAAPLVMGGIAAGAIGFAAAYFGLAQQPDTRGDALSKSVADLTQLVEDQSGALQDLSTKVDDMSGLDAAALDAQTEALGTLSERVASIEGQYDTLESRLRELEIRPVSEGASDAAIAAYEQELDAARRDIADQRAELQSLIDQALSTENAADEAARASIQRAATSRILAALDSGTAFAGAVAELEATGVEVPDALSSIADTGVTPLSALQESFPDAARAALDASRSVSGEGTGLTGFLRNQLGARSLEPREGNDPDAVLSRVEAATREGRLGDALAELEALPEEGRAELSDWSGQVAQRLEALGAAQTLSETIN